MMFYNLIVKPWCASGGLVMNRLIGIVCLMLLNNLLDKIQNLDGMVFLSLEDGQPTVCSHEDILVRIGSIQNLSEIAGIPTVKLDEHPQHGHHTVAGVA